MKHSQKRTFMDIEKMSSDEFKAFCRLGNKNHFTRIRKMPLQDLLFTMMIIPGLFEPPVRTLRATIPENESHIFR